VFWFCLQVLFENISHSKKNLARYRYKRRNVFMNGSRYSCRILTKLELSRRIKKKSVIEIRPVGAELFHADWQKDGRTDMTKLTVAFRNFANAPKNDSRTTVCNPNSKRIAVESNVKRDVNGRAALKLKDAKWLPSAACNEFLKALRNASDKYWVPWVYRIKCYLKLSSSDQTSQ
jgi:NADH:ubiquinone oxidoreductase subunit